RSARSGRLRRLRCFVCGRRRRGFHSGRSRRRLPADADARPSGRGRGMGRVRAAAMALAVLPAVVSAQDAKPATAPPDMVVETDAGSFVVRLRPDLAPAHVAHFVKTARAGGYDHTTFHRIIAGGIIHGGDPLSREPAKAEVC